MARILSKLAHRSRILGWRQRSLPGFIRVACLAAQGEAAELSLTIAVWKAQCPAQTIHVQKHTLRFRIGYMPETTIIPKHLVETALRVLVAWTDGRRPASSTDLDILKEAFPSSAHLPDDELACQVIHDLSGIAFREPSLAVTALPMMEEVA